MKKKQSESSARDKRPTASERHIPDSKLDFSDIPELTEEELKGGRRVGRPKSDKTKQLIAVRLDPELLGKLRELAAKQDKPYQTLMHELLETAVEDEAA